MNQTVFERRKICKEKAGRIVLSDFYLLLRRGEIVNLIGLEGCGHEELRSMFLYNEPISSGSVYYDGRQIKTIEELPLERYHGIFYIGNKDLLIPDLTVAENLYIVEKMNYLQFSVSLRKMIRQAEELFSRFRIDLDPSRKAGSLDRFESALVRFMRAYIKRAKIMIVDDLLDDYSQERIAQLCEILKAFQNDGISILWMNNYPDDVSRIADRVEVISEKKNAFGFRKGAFDPELIQRTMIGEISLDAEHGEHQIGSDDVFSAVSLTGGSLCDISFSCYKGEILGLYDIQNRFNKKLYEILSGKQPYEGECCVCGKILKTGSNDVLLRGGVVLINGEDYQNMIFRNLSLEENLSMASWKKAARGIFLTRRVRKYLYTVSRQLAVQYQINRQVSTVNRQEAVRIIFNRYLLSKPSVFFCFQPFLRLDAVSRNFLSEFFSSVCKNGCGVVLGSANLSDLETICDRILEIHHNRIVRTRVKGTDY